MTVFLTLVQAANIEDAYSHLVFLGYLVSMEEDSVGRTFSSMIASPSWLPVFQKQMKNTSVHWQIRAIKQMVERVNILVIQRCIVKAGS